MKKRILMAVALMITAMMLCSCSMINVSTIEALYRPSSEAVITSGEPTAAPQADTGDTVTISREEYESDGDVCFLGGFD